MSESYCGNNCSNCQFKEELKCAGCQDGPGRFPNGECIIARCCRKSNCESCGKCNQFVGCSTRVSRTKAAERRLEQKRGVKSHAEEAGKWLTILFWLIIPSTISGVLSAIQNEKLVVIGFVIGALCSLANGIILFKLKNVKDEYGTAGICSLVVAAFNILQFFTGSILIINLAIIVIGLFGLYNECTAHSEILSNIGSSLAESWESYWKWVKRLYIAIMGCIISAFLTSIFAAICLLIVALGIVILAFYKLSLLYNTAKALRQYKF